MQNPEEKRSADPSAMGDTDEHRDGRFEFGLNWSRFLAALDEKQISEAQQSVEHLLRVTNLESKRFLDAGSGSGLFSLAAYRLGADVTSFDVDSECVSCSCELRSRFAGRDTIRWTVTQGSLLDTTFLGELGEFDVVYCWGVAHHSGDLWQAMENLSRLVTRGGVVVLAIYNDQQYISRAWQAVKSVYQRLPRSLRPVYVLCIGAMVFVKRAAVTFLACSIRLVTFRNPLVPVLNWIRDGRARGMRTWYDLVDWVGGWPFEVARPEEVFRFLRDRDFILRELTTSGGHGCNEFVFVRSQETEIV